jgi:hypothetical protein
MLVDMAGFSIKAKVDTGSGDPADLAVGTNTVVGRVAGNIVAAQLVNAQITDATIAYAKIQNVSATDRILGRDTAGAGVIEELQVSGGLEFTGTGIQRSALTGDVTASAGNNSTTIANNAVTNAKAADMAANTIKGNNTAGSTDPTDISVGTNTVLGRVAGNIVAAQLVAAQITDDTITYNKIQNVSATSRFLGRITAGAGDIEELTGTQATTLLDIFTSGLQGVVPASGGGSTNFLRADGVWAAPPGAGGGEANTASNLGTGQGVFKTKVGVDLQFRSLTASSTKITLANNTNDIGIDVTEANLTLSNIGGSLAIGQVPDDLITYAKIQNVSATARVLGRATAGAGDIEELTLNSTLEFSGTSIRRAALTGDVTASAGSNSTTIANAAVTLAKLADLATDKLIGRDTAGTGVPEAIGVNQGIQFDGSGNIQVGTINLIDNSANDILYTLDSFAKRSCGYAYATGEAVPSTSMMLGTSTVTSTGALAGGLDAGGTFLTMNTGTSSNTSCGIRFARTIVRRDFNFRFLVRFSISTVTNTRFYCGLKEGTGAFPASDTPLGSTDHGILFGYRSSDSQALQVFHNDGSAGVTNVSTGVTIAAGTVYDLEIISDEANSRFRWRTRTDFGSWSAYTDVTTNMPAATDPLVIDMSISNSSGVDRTLQFRRMEIYSDK